MNDLGSRFLPQVLSIARIATAFMFFQHGTAKLLGVPHVAMFDALSVLSLAGVAGILELVGGALLLVGWQTRLTAFVLSGQMAVAYFIAHATKGPVLSPMLNGGEPAALFCFVFLVLAAAGGGAWGVDALRARRA